MTWTFYPAFIGTAISVVAWTYFAWREHVTHMPRTLSELASEQPEGMQYYRTVLWTCGPLFGITTLFYITPRVDNPIPIAIASAVMVSAEMLAGIYPARRGKVTAHDIIAGIMGFAMTLLAFLFVWSLDGSYSYVELGFAAVMSILAICTMLDRKRYLFYELPFIYLSHFSVLAAALALA